MARVCCKVQPPTRPPQPSALRPVPLKSKILVTPLVLAIEKPPCLQRLLGLASPKRSSHSDVKSLRPQQAHVSHLYLVAFLQEPGFHERGSRSDLRHVTRRKVTGFLGSLGAFLEKREGERHRASERRSGGEGIPQLRITRIAPAVAG